MSESGGLPSAFAHLFARDWPSMGHRIDGDDVLLTRALIDAARGIGRTSPNPPVGACMVTATGAMVVGHHARAGFDHAEVVCLKRGTHSAAGATMAVTLEPCAHHGRTPPCADRLVKESVKRVIIGTRDPNPAVYAKGIAALVAAGIDVVEATGVLELAARALIAPFTTVIRQKRPYVIVKTATTLDGKVAANGGDARFITGPDARALVHQLRDSVDVILTGSGTVLRDDPELTTRVTHSAREVKNPRRVLVDSALRVGTSAKIFAQRSQDRAPTMVFHTDGAPRDRAQALDAMGVTRIPCEGTRVALSDVLTGLAREGALSVLVEAGPGLVDTLLEQGLVDEIWWMRAPSLLGSDAIPVSGPHGITRASDAHRVIPISEPTVVGEDTLQVFRPHATTRG